MQICQIAGICTRGSGGVLSDRSFCYLLKSSNKENESKRAWNLLAALTVLTLTALSGMIKTQSQCNVMDQHFC